MNAYLDGTHAHSRMYMQTCLGNGINQSMSYIQARTVVGARGDGVHGEVELVLPPELEARLGQRVVPLLLWFILVVS